MRKIKFLGLIIAVSWFASCISFEKPGEGEAAIYGLKCMYIIQDEIYKYKLKNNNFPDDLTFLNNMDIPQDWKITDTFVALTGIEKRKCTIEYRKHNEYFELEFTYTPPGMNKMKYNSINKKWEIRGYY